jgi:hypothetical protein
MHRLPAASAVPVRLDSIPVRPDAVTGPRAWPDPDLAPLCDERCDEDYPNECDAGEWHDLYSALYAAHERLLSDVRDAVAQLALATTQRHTEDVSKWLRARLGEAQVRRTTGRWPKP